MTDIYTALMKAADHIKHNPKNFMFSASGVPCANECGTPGCAMGWIAAYMGHESGTEFYAAHKELGLSPEAQDNVPSHGAHVSFAFYNRMDSIHGSYRWRCYADECARSLRLYAAKYHAPKPALNWERIAMAPESAAAVRDNITA